VGNPPYSTNPSLQNAKPLYNLFVEKYIDITSNFLFITPSRWFSGGKGLDKFRKFMLSRKDIQLIQHYDNCKECFPSVEIKGGVSYFLKVPGVTECYFNGIKIDLSKYDILVEPKYIEILEKTRNYPSVSDIYMNRGYYKLETNDKNLRDTKEDNDVTCYVSELKKKDRKKYVNNKFCKDAVWKVITARASGGGRSGFGFMAVIQPDEIYTNSYIGFKVGNKEEGENLISYLKCKLPNLLLACRKISQDISTDTVKWIPIVPLDRKWTDETVYEYFGIDE